MTQMQNEPRSCHSRLHLVAVFFIELVAGGGKLLGDNIAQVHQVGESLLEGFQGGG